VLFFNLTKFNQNEVLNMKIKNLEDESDIADTAAKVLRETFIKVSRTETVLYVENDAVWSKAPNGTPVLIKQLSGRNTDLAKKISSRGTYKIKRLFALHG
jgi:hypothetical protein